MRIDSSAIRRSTEPLIREREAALRSVLEGRKLTSYQDRTTNTTINYQYNDKGLRVKKTKGSTVTEYFYEGNRLTAVKTGIDTKQYSYDEDGMLASININGIEYYYVRDISQTILGLIDTSGNIAISVITQNIMAGFFIGLFLTGFIIFGKESNKEWKQRQAIRREFDVPSTY